MTLELTERGSTRKALGRGLASLLPEANTEKEDKFVYEKPAKTTSLAELTESRKYFNAPIDAVIPCANQPRQNFNAEELKELADSIREMGVIQPVIVRTQGDKFEIIAGERRWRASQMAGLREIPVVVKDMTDKSALQAALVENIQRADLNAIEEARAYKQLIDEYSMTQEELSKKIGKDRSSIANLVRLLKLPSKVQSAIVEGRLSMGQARTLCSIEDESMLMVAADLVIEQNYSVRQTEDLVRKIKEDGLIASVAKKKETAQKDSAFSPVEDRLREKFQTKVKIAGKRERGRIIIEYFTSEDFDRIYGMIG